MALKLTVPSDVSGIGVQMTDAYVRIAHMSFFADIVRFQVQFYVSADARASASPFKTVEESMVGFDHGVAKSPKAQLYEHLKTLPLYDQGVDV